MLRESHNTLQHQIWTLSKLKLRTLTLLKGFPYYYLATFSLIHGLTQIYVIAVVKEPLQ